MVRESLLLSLDMNLNVYSWEEKLVEELGEEEEEETLQTFHVPSTF